MFEDFYVFSNNMLCISATSDQNNIVNITKYGFTMRLPCVIYVFWSKVAEICEMLFEPTAHKYLKNTS